MSKITLKELRTEISRCAVEARRWKEDVPPEPTEATIRETAEPPLTEDDYLKPFQRRVPEHALMELLDRPNVEGTASAPFRSRPSRAAASPRPIPRGRYLDQSAEEERIENTRRWAGIRRALASEVAGGRAAG